MKSDAWGFNRWFIVTVALVIGFLIGVACVAYLVYAWVPADVILRDAPPRFLRFDPAGDRPDYRDVYVARVAARYAQGVQIGQPEAALTQAQQALGVTTGDATPIEALAMVRSAEQVARNENAREGDNPDQGWFTLADQNSLTLLAERLEQVKDQPPVIAQSVIEARRNAALLGGLLLLLWIAVLTGLLLLVVRLLKPAPVSATASVVAPRAAGEAEARPGTVINVNPADGQVAAATPAAAPTEPGTIPAVYAPAPVRVGSPLPGESLINTFRAVYEHGNENFDEGFQISATSGELIGECGASVADRVSLTSPSRVIALAIWTFDKNDFQSTTKVMLTPYAYRNNVMRSKLAARGELVQAGPGIFEIATSTLRVEVEVRDLQLLPLDGDPDGYFQRVELEFRVYKKP
ncbi:MAG: hypothetical protein D6709_10070 [Chloroflexi bacterium]|jgi:hypothetical protein|uniref:Uncharacterized protein n=1 Tax=Candidatus Thermofonsia Clade 3 bacterium TaxID=2364212 RepID=A0A2M8QG40_9CHLR|nr:hypothetical protein [Candidatus Roseilinea sp. NK_OTU-006]PJF48738.1 MAG: hypothetical protein CUN48_01970 [Candidatus Thermofonsia Clade 3 bacterium]RMG62916.1 MAG: hypothetical protein D6709_10070 [Chloroflexota bacterium]